MNNITLTTSLVNQIMAYLGTRPYQEVYQLIDLIQKEAQANVQAQSNVGTTQEE